MYSRLKKRHFPITLTVVGLLVSGIIIYLSIPKDWEEAAEMHEDGTASISEEWSETVERKKDQFRNQELYKLTATKDAYYLCEHCPTGKFFLRENEVYRYGTTGLKEKGRGYGENWRKKYFLNYVVIMQEDLTTVKIEQAALIGSYVILPENLNRPAAGTPQAKPYWYRLVLPPGNNSLD